MYSVKKFLVGFLMMLFLMPSVVSAETLGLVSIGSVAYPGIATYNSGGSQTDATAGMTLDANDNVYIVGYQTTNGGDVVMQKFNSDGTLDVSWGGGDGTVTYSRDGLEIASDVVVDASGNSYLSGSVVVNGEDRNAVVLKYNSSGVLDTSWGGGDGVFEYNSSGAQHDGFRKIAIDASGNLYVSGFTGDNGQDIAVFKLTSAGILDVSWSGDGIATYNSGGTQNDGGTTPMLANDGSVYVSGIVSTPGQGTDIVVLKYNSSGVLDTSWAGGDGIALYQSAGSQSDQLLNSFRDADGSIYVVGFHYTTYTTADAHIIKFDAQGVLDTSWGGGDGVVVYDAGGYEDFQSALIHDGYLYAVGRTSSNGGDVLMQRFDSQGILDTSWGNLGLVTYDSGSGVDQGAVVAIDSYDRLIIGGSIGSNGTDRALFRYTTDGVLDISFGATPVPNFPSGYVLASKAHLQKKAKSFDSVSVYAADVVGTTTLAIYDKNFDLVWESGPLSSGISNNWLTVPISSGTPAVVANMLPSDYYLAFQMGGAGSVPTFVRGAYGDGLFVPQPFGAFANPLQNAVTTDMVWSMYVNYTHKSDNPAAKLRK